MRRVFSSRNVIIFLAAFLLLSYYGSFVATDYLWFSSLGFQGVFVTGILSRVLLGLAVGLAAFLFILANVLVAKGQGPMRPLDIYTPQDQLQIHIPPQVFQLVTYLGPLAIAILMGFGAAGSWLVVQKFLHATPFGLTDPFFGRDVGFYVFDMPFWRLLYSNVMVVLFVSLAASALFYLGNRGIDLLGQPRFSRRAWRHLSLLVGAMVLVKAGGYFLGQLNLLYSSRGVAFGASYADVHAQLPALRILMVLALAVGGLIIVNGWLRRTRLVIFGLGFLVAVSLVVGTAYPAFVQQFTVEPDEIRKETQYIEHNIAFTRAAFDLNRVTERDYPVTNNLTLRDIQDDTATISNVRLWDWRPLRDTYGQLQAIRLYYDFADVDLDRYVVDGRYRQVTIAAREINHNLLPAEARTWMNQHLVFTHGYGVVMSPTTSVTPEGLPFFYVKDIPPKSTVPELKVTRPEIYYGELTDTYAIVNTTTKEFDFPVGDQNQYSIYAGTGGIQMSNPLIRAAFAVRLRSYQILLADSITSESRVLLNRNIGGLVRQIAPFLTYDGDPYIVLGTDGRLSYIIDAYTTTSLYPYSQRHGSGINYIRNSVKVVIDAYNGATTFYLFGKPDPLAETYAAIFPTLFKPGSEMPADLKDHVRYPSDLFSLQADMYSTYHMQDPQVFYNREDLYQRPGQLYSSAERPSRTGQTTAVEPHYMILRMPGEKKEELVQMLPYSPKDKSNMIAWIAARSDGESYGDLLVFKFPKEQLVYGPMQIEARIDQDTTISQNLTLWNQVGSSVIRGTLLVIPVKNSILYAQPLYLQASGNKLPELKRVIVAYGNRVVMTETLNQSLEAIFGQGAGTGPVTVPGGTTPQPGQTDAQRLSELARRANDLYVKAVEASKRGDWAAYGDFLTQLGHVLNELQRLSGAGAGDGTPGGASVPGGLGPAS